MNYYERAVDGEDHPLTGVQNQKLLAGVEFKKGPEEL